MGILSIILNAQEDVAENSGIVDNVENRDTSPAFRIIGRCAWCRYPQRGRARPMGMLWTSGYNVP